MENGILSKWEESTTEERKEFLLELNKRYKFERLCSALHREPDGILCRKANGYGSMESIFRVADGIDCKVQLLKRFHVIEEEEVFK